jgi:hypothetical protein
VLFIERPITFAHVRDFCGKFSEGLRVEYKRDFDANVREKLPKVVSSFANSHGGVLIVGSTRSMVNRRLRLRDLSRRLGLNSCLP